MQEQNEEKLQERRKRLTVAFVAAGTMLLFVLVIFLCIQFAMMGIGNATKKRLDKEIEDYNEIIAEGKNDLDYYSSEMGKYHLAIEQGWKPKKK